MRDLLRHRCTIRRSVAENYEGRVVHSYSDVATGVPCLVQESAGSTRQTSAGEVYVAESVGFFPPNVDLRPDAGNDQPDQVVMTAPARLAGAVFRVLGVADEAGQDHHLVAKLVRLPDQAPA